MLFITLRSVGTVLFKVEMVKWLIKCILRLIEGGLSLLFLIYMQHSHVVDSFWMIAWFFFFFFLAWWHHGKQTSKKRIYFHVFPLFTYLCLSLFLLLFVSHFSFVFCLICLPSANAFHPRLCGLQPLQPSGLQQPPAGRELRRLQQGNELMEGFGEGEKKQKRGMGSG